MLTDGGTCPALAKVWPDLIAVQAADKRPAPGLDRTWCSQIKTALETFVPLSQSHLKFVAQTKVQSEFGVTRKSSWTKKP